MPVPQLGVGVVGESAWPFLTCSSDAEGAAIADPAIAVPSARAMASVRKRDDDMATLPTRRSAYSSRTRGGRRRRGTREAANGARLIASGECKGGGQPVARRSVVNCIACAPGFTRGPPRAWRSARRTGGRPGGFDGAAGGKRADPSARAASATGPASSRRNRPRPDCTMRISGQRSSSRRRSRIRRLSRLSLNSGRPSDSSRRRPRLVNSAAAAGRVLAQHLPQHLRRQAAHQVLAVDQDRLVAGVVLDLQPARGAGGGSGRRGSGPRRQRLALLRALAQQRVLDRDRQVAAEHLEVGAVLLVEAVSRSLSTHSTPTSSSRTSSGMPELRLGLGQARQRDAPLLGAQAARPRVLADGLRVEHLAQHARDADRLPRLGHHADDPLAEAHLGADAALGIAAARDQLEPVGPVAGEQDHRVPEAEQALDASRGSSRAGSRASARGGCAPRAPAARAS